MSDSPLKNLLRDELSRLGVSRNELLRRMGYINLDKGQRRLREFEAGNLRIANMLKDRLAAGLDLPIETVVATIAEERRARVRVKDAAYRAAFQPHAIYLTERTVPSQITICGLVNGDRLRVVIFGDDVSSETYVHHVMQRIPDGLPFFGAVTGFALNYSPDQAVFYDRDGNVVKTADQAYRVGESNYWV